MAIVENRFVHTVYFWFKEKNNQDQKSIMQAELLKLGQIDLIESAYIGKPADTNREVIDSSYDFSITFVFKNKADQDAYQIHPDHYKFIDACSSFWEKVQVYDAC
jgi:hypothetical protein